MEIRQKFTTELNAFPWALGACGLTGLWRLSYSGTEVPNQHRAAEILREISQKVSYRGGVGEGNFIFSVDSTQLEYRKTTTNALTKYLLAHPNTKIIHHYTNNAHGPSIVFICIHHMFPEEVKHPIVNNIEEYANRMKYDADKHTYYLEDVK